ncbi:MAG: hypothetical protein GY737_30940, partial [Desulfobacteraceae bacterium]|nr:hypothetical protein [Desulfobacteraceae bacterium]
MSIDKAQRVSLERVSDILKDFSLIIAALPEKLEEPNQDRTADIQVLILRVETTSHSERYLAQKEPTVADRFGETQEVAQPEGEGVAAPPAGQPEPDEENRPGPTDTPEVQIPDESEKQQEHSTQAEETEAPGVLELLAMTKPQRVHRQRHKSTSSSSTTSTESTSQ